MKKKIYKVFSMDRLTASGIRIGLKVHGSGQCWIRKGGRGGTGIPFDVKCRKLDNNLIAMYTFTTQLILEAKTIFRIPEKNKSKSGQLIFIHPTAETD